MDGQPYFTSSVGGKPRSSIESRSPPTHCMPRQVIQLLERRNSFHVRSGPTSLRSSWTYFDTFTRLTEKLRASLTDGHIHLRSYIYLHAQTWHQQQHRRWHGLLYGFHTELQRGYLSLEALPRSLKGRLLSWRIHISSDGVALQASVVALL
jgi:hypothetical protein